MKSGTSFFSCVTAALIVSAPLLGSPDARENRSPEYSHGLPAASVAHAAPVLPSADQARVIRADLVNVVANGSFEQNGGPDSNSFASWTVFDQEGGSGTWYAQTGTGARPGTQTCSQGTPVPPPPSGSFAAMASQGGPGSHILFQDVTLSGPTTLSFDLYLQNYGPPYVVSPNGLGYINGENQHFRVDIMDPTAPVMDVGSGVLRNIYITNPSDPAISGYTRISADLSAFAGLTVRIRFAEVDTKSCLLVGLDNVQIQAGIQQSTPQILSFIASPSVIRLGQSSTLFFSTQNETSVSIDNGVTVSGTSGSVIVSPAQTTTYTLTATAADGSRATSQVTVTVITVPAVLITGLPRGLLQNPGIGGATDRLSLTNTGGAPAVLTLTQSGNFFTISPTNLTIAPGETQIITISGTPQVAGTYDGLIMLSGSGIPGTLPVPVRLFVSAPAVGSVTPVPVINRVDVTQPSGTVQITNSGSATLQGILASDVPWLIPQSGIITIPAGQTVTVSFVIDRTKRPDGDNPIGAVSGNMTLIYLEGTVPGLTTDGIRSLEGNTTPTGNIKIQVVDLAAPATANAAVPPLGSGEIALFLPGVSKRKTAVSDVTLTNTALSVAVDDVRMFFAPSASTATSLQQASLKPIAPSGKALFSDVVKGVFGRGEGESGGLQIRTQNAARVTLAAAVTNPSNATGLYGDAIASFRSDRSVGPSEKLVLAGVRSDSGTRTDVYLQETAGQAGSVKTEFLDEMGLIRKTRTDAIGAFSTIELTNEAPAGAVTAAITNLATGGSRLQARAIVVDLSTGDVTDIVDWNRRNGTPSSDVQIVPYVEVRTTSGKKTRTDLAVANLGSTPSRGTLSFFAAAGPVKRRAVNRNGSGSSGSGGFDELAISRLAAEQVITVDPGRTRLISDVLTTQFGVGDGTTGYLLYTPASGEVNITAHTYAPSGGTAGTGVPVLASSFGIGRGQTRLFVNLDDASADTVRTAEKATYRTGFGLIESAGKTVTVKVTLRYQTAVTGGLAAAQLNASREYALAPRGIVSVRELSQTLFGAGREKLGDLHDLVLEVAVTGGEGRVIPYTLATENGSSDMILRIE